ncbi:dnaJ homolog subfamily C member 18-like [Pecten maximus]|uniref:dnaJ homolog subfamily C member 18-like n=1 Tax=Pecten maximus TaxID=6579 RepID=UPI0014583C14|nr:dnaJ homolog subfamily C member 18-like [Pecten maximus]
MQLQQTSLYEVLGVGEDATDGEIKSAYFVLSKKFHPDFNLDFDTKVEFMQVQNAYKVLSSPMQRSAYDSASNSISKRAMYHDIYRTHGHKPSAWEHITTPSIQEQIHHFHNFNRNQASDPPPTKKQEMGKWEQKWRTNYVAFFSIVGLSFSAWFGYILWKRLEDRQQSSNESLKSALESRVSPLRARQDRKSTDLAKVKELDIPRREQKDK